MRRPTDLSPWRRLSVHLRPTDAWPRAARDVMTVDDINASLGRADDTSRRLLSFSVFLRLLILTIWCPRDGDEVNRDLPCLDRWKGVT